MDLTILMMTPNRVPTKWAEYHREKLLEASDGADIITISSKPLDWGINIIQNDYGFTNIFRQMLRGAKKANTEFIAMADDDTLYTKEHFSFRPHKNEFYYNLNRWHLFTWGEPFYFHKPLPGNGLLICRTQSMINGLENRFSQYPDELPGYACHELGVRGDSRKYDVEKWKQFYTTDPVVSFYHEESLDKANRNRTKRAWPVRAYDIPVWGHARELRERWIEK